VLKHLTARQLASASAILCLMGLTAALISQHGFGFAPCAWCVLQRLLLILIGVASFFAATAPATARFGRPLFLGTAAVLSIGGIAAAWFQITVAANLFSCSQTFADKFMTQTGLDSAIPWLFGIYATCADARVNLLGVDYVLWALALFILLFILLGIAFVEHVRSTKQPRH